MAETVRELNSYLRDIDDIFDGGARFEANEQRLAKQLASQQAALRSRSQQAQNELASQLSDLHAAHRQAQERASSLGVSGVPNQDANPTGPDFAGLHELLDRLEAAQRAVRLSDRMSKAKTFDWITLAAGIAITLVASYFSLKLGSVVFLLPLLVVGLMVCLLYTSDAADE